MAATKLKQIHALRWLAERKGLKVRELRLQLFTKLSEAEERALVSKVLEHLTEINYNPPTPPKSTQTQPLPGDLVTNPAGAQGVLFPDGVVRDREGNELMRCDDKCQDISEHFANALATIGWSVQDMEGLRLKPSDTVPGRDRD